MTVSVLHIWVCDNCGNKDVQDIDASVYSDPIVELPKGWKIVARPADRRTFDMDDAMEVCGDCAHRFTSVI